MKEIEVSALADDMYLLRIEDYKMKGLTGRLATMWALQTIFGEVNIPPRKLLDAPELGEIHLAPILQNAALRLFKMGDDYLEAEGVCNSIGNLATSPVPDYEMILNFVTWSALSEKCTFPVSAVDIGNFSDTLRMIHTDGIGEPFVVVKYVDDVKTEEEKVESKLPYLGFL